MRNQDKTETPKHPDLPHFWAFVEQINRKKDTTTSGAKDNEQKKKLQNTRLFPF